ncbi:MAG: hypothetical protein RL660_863 [Bacteroidota bacterium]|jgi:DNA-binding Xre family transcriptional regulator
MIRKKRRKLYVAGTALRLCVLPLLEERHIVAKHAFLLKHGFSRQTATKVLQGKQYIINVVQLQALCDGLQCTVDDLFVRQ